MVIVSIRQPADSIFPKIRAPGSLSDFSVHIKIMERKFSIKRQSSMRKQE
jgi:hypothetical protein